MFSNGSLSSISLATVTPSFVMVGDPNFRGSQPCRFNSLRKNRVAARRLRRDCTRMSRTSPSVSAASVENGADPVKLFVSKEMAFLTSDPRLRRPIRGMGWLMVGLSAPGIGHQWRSYLTVRGQSAPTFSFENPTGFGEDAEMPDNLSGYASTPLTS